MNEATLKSDPRPTLTRYAFAALIALLAMTARLLLELWLALDLPFLTFFPAVAGTAWLFGYGPALFTLILSVFLTAYFFLPPELSFSLNRGGVVPLVVFVLVSALVIAMGDSARRRHQEAERMAGILKKSEERMRATLLQLQESRERQEIAVNAAGLGVFELHRKRRYVVWENRRMYEIFGHDPTEAPVDGESFIESYLHEDDREAFLESLKDGKAGIEAVRDFRPDLVLLDIGLPGMDGYEVARRIRLLPEGAAVGLFALTGWGQDKDKEKAFAAGFDEHLTKPVDTARLLALFPIYPLL